VNRWEEAHATRLSKLTVRPATLTELPGRKTKSNHQPDLKSFLLPVKSASGKTGNFQATVLGKHGDECRDRWAAILVVRRQLNRGIRARWKYAIYELILQTASPFRRPPFDHRNIPRHPSPWFLPDARNGAPAGQEG